MRHDPTRLHRRAHRRGGSFRRRHRRDPLRRGLLRRGPLRWQRLRAWWWAVRMRLDQVPHLVFFGASAVLGVDAFGMLLGLLPLYPTMVPFILVGCAVVYAGVRGVRWVWGRRGR